MGKNQFQFHSRAFQNTYAISIGFYVQFFFLILENYLEMCNDINIRLNLIVLNSILVKQFRNYLASLLLMKLIPNV